MTTLGVKIPEFASREQEAEFWEKHGLEHLVPGEIELAPGKRSAAPLSVTFAVRFDRETVSLLRKAARAHNLGPTQLVRAWVIQRLERERRSGALKKQEADLPVDMQVRSAVAGVLMAQAPAVADALIEAVGKITSNTEVSRETKPHRASGH